MHADEVHTDVDLVWRLLAAQLPQWVLADHTSGAWDQPVA